MDKPGLYIFVCHPVIVPRTQIIEHIPDVKYLHWMTHWDPDLTKFLKKNAMLWSRQKSTLHHALVIDDADYISVHGYSCILGLLEQGFSRPIVLIVSNVQRIPSSIYNRSEIVTIRDYPVEISGWKTETPDIHDHSGWERVLRS